MSRYPRWTEEEDALLINLWQTGAIRKRIAHEFEGRRSLHAVSGRLDHLVDQGVLPVMYNRSRMRQPRVSFELTEEFKEEIEREAAKAGMPLSRWIIRQLKIGRAS